MFKYMKKLSFANKINFCLKVHFRHVFIWMFSFFGRQLKNNFLKSFYKLLLILGFKRLKKNFILVWFNFSKVFVKFKSLCYLKKNFSFLNLVFQKQFFVGWVFLVFLKKKFLIDKVVLYKKLGGFLFCRYF